MNTNSATFWDELDRMLSDHEVIIDRPRGSEHPRCPGLRYPFDYGYLNGTTSGDGPGIDVWLGASGSRALTGVLCTVDALKSDAEIKLLLGCAREDVETIASFLDGMGVLYIPRYQ